jgi:hypothetical protein
MYLIYYYPRIKESCDDGRFVLLLNARKITGRSGLAWLHTVTSPSHSRVSAALHCTGAGAVVTDGTADRSRHDYSAIATKNSRMPDGKDRPKAGVVSNHLLAKLDNAPPPDLFSGITYFLTPPPPFYIFFTMCLPVLYILSVFSMSFTSPISVLGLPFHSPFSVHG